MHRPSFTRLAKEDLSDRANQADLVLLNPHKEWTVTTDCIESKCGWSPMEGRTFHAQVEKTFVNGTAVYENGKVNKAHRGQALRFER